jgi:hypothetical protein
MFRQQFVDDMKEEIIRCDMKELFGENVSQKRVLPTARTLFVVASGVFREIGKCLMSFAG